LINSTVARATEKRSNLSRVLKDTAKLNSSLCDKKDCQKMTEISPAETDQSIKKRVLGKVAWRLIPFMGLLYFVAFLDRVNIGFASLTMNEDLGFSATVYGIGAGIFFIGYFLFEIPSNIMLEKIGARRWIARIMITWGILSAAMAFINSPTSFYILRFLLGLAEAGFFPGMILYLTYWFPFAYRARIVGTFMIAIPLSNVIGAPFSGYLLGLGGLGLKGWQWLFIVEGLPAVLLGFVVLFFLTDKPNQACLAHREGKRLARRSSRQRRAVHSAKT
jgi:MFS transporter, ACS family, tartrate transporter